MIKKEDIVEIGKFQKTHALKGELNALLDIEEDYVEEGNPLVVEIDGIFVPFYGASIRPKGSESYLIQLDGVDSQEKAQELVNKTIYGLRENLIDYFDDPEMVMKSDFIGYMIKDENHGEIGKVVDIDDSTANVLFVVENKDGKKIYIPVADEFIISIDDEYKLILVSLPDGLIDL